MISINNINHLQRINFTGRYVPACVSRRYENIIFKTILTPNLDYKASRFPSKIRSSIEPFLQKFDVPVGNGNMSIWELNPENSERYILFLHGIKGTSKLPPNQIFLEKVMQNGGYGIVTPEYRGSGDLSRQPFNFASVIEDSKSTLKYLYEKGIKPENITIISHCVGSIPTSVIASGEERFHKIIMVSPLSDGSELGSAILKMFGLRVPEFMERGLNRFIDIFQPYDMNINRVIEQVESPVVLVVPELDKLVSVKYIENLSKRIKNLLGVVKIPDAEHALQTKTSDVIIQNL